MLLYCLTRVLNVCAFLVILYHFLSPVHDVSYVAHRGQLVLNIKLKYYLVNKMYSHSAVYLYVGRATVITLQY